MNKKDIFEFYKNKRILITGHTGFKGTWLCKILQMAGSDVIGYSIDYTTNPNLHHIIKFDEKIKWIKGDIRDYDSLKNAFDLVKPEIVFHLAAQPIVIESYNNPRYTYETNVMGTVNVLECIRNSDSVKAFVNVTTDKVYQNDELDKGYVEDDILNGYDPYSNSKSCSELVTSCYKNSFFSNNNVRISTVRAGNVIGGGDFSDNRIIPDCVRAVLDKKEILVRNPNSIRPFQHVLEPLFAYMMIAKEEYFDEKYCSSYNIGPEYEDCITTGELVTKFCDKWGENLKWHTENVNGPHEANFLKLDTNKIKEVFNWKATWNIDNAIDKIVEFYKVYELNQDVEPIMEKQINEFINE